ncbi:cyclic nucleotide-binding and patatin-like phospholipase domain-containing protein [Erythrobacter sp.]|uniref:cyclic nucleotide-binding and patatin-like phospholipase domain-containing protein n=1 Tax=Erythrobacter sp. TaxID=1042 RepID=UPI001425D67D|nr:cyclic nucleotide-binding and patatin-like phospholipase domain-containing protein [Erythrobacter sp.]QIQ85290.1 MAG: cyclic nucleotide-binding domain-containing protein [Erythrobacter sp.]
MASDGSRSGTAGDFAQVEAFAGLGEAALGALRAAARIEAVRGGELLVRHGETADTLYIVATGRFHVMLPDGRVVAEIEPGEPVGELAFFAGGTRTADVRASRDSTVFALTRTAYDAVSAEHREIADTILAEIARRLARSTAGSAAMPARPGRVVALLPAGGSAIPEGLADRLAEHLSRHDDIRLVRAADRPDGLDPASEAFGDWIAGVEASAARVLLVAEGEEAWDRAIARNADDLLLLAPLAGTDTSLSALEDYALPRFFEQDRTLLLWRERAGEAIAGTARWLDPRPVKLHHHVALDEEAGIARLARFMAGRANGIVLAGGGALGCAHLGVMQALIENSIPIDFYGGTSAGAAMAGALAQGLTPDEVVVQMEEMFIARRAMKRVTLPVHSFLDARVFDEELRRRYPAGDIADLPTGFFAVSTNLSTNAVHVHRRGPLWEAVRASGSLPTILPPFVTEEGEVLVDGGVLDNVPVEIMRAAKTGPNVVVALRADAGAAWRIEARYGDVRSPGRLARDLILRRRPERAFPSLVEIMSRSMVVASESAVRAALDSADALLVPPIPETMQLLDWHRGREVAEAARRFTAGEIARRSDLAAMKAA